MPLARLNYDRYAAKRCEDQDANGLERTPMGRIGEVKEIASVSFLVSVKLVLQARQFTPMVALPLGYSVQPKDDESKPPTQCCQEGYVMG